MVLAEIVILLTGVISRFCFNRPLASDKLASIVFLWLAMFGAAIALRRDTHMRMTLISEFASGLARCVLEVLAIAVPCSFSVSY
jgi:TRAP-type C4-dicarboxylate transport system permease small subunit